MGGNNIILTDVLSDIAADTTEYDLITVALGINDYNGASNVGSLTDDAETISVVGRIKKLLNQITVQFPNSRIIFISPFNCRRHGDKESKFCINSPHNGYTLQQISNIIKNVCDIYEIEYIDALNFGPININNIQKMTPDKVHPSSRCHELLANYLYSKIGF